jgi:hypothetical protein
LRGERFVDIHAIIKESLKASVERYSLKDLEGFTTYKRKIDLPVASISRRALECALELKEIASSHLYLKIRFNWFRIIIRTIV